jgi:hypothetical protein
MNVHHHQVWSGILLLLLLLSWLPTDIRPLPPETCLLKAHILQDYPSAAMPCSMPAAFGNHSGKEHPSPSGNSFDLLFWSSLICSSGFLSSALLVFFDHLFL